MIVIKDSVEQEKKTKIQISTTGWGRLDYDGLAYEFLWPSSDYPDGSRNRQ